MIYLDSAATTLLKPPEVKAAVISALDNMSTPGRGSHSAAMRAADAAFDCRQALSDFFNVSDPERVVFTFNATHALNIAMRSLIGPGDKVVVSGYEHNAVTRQLFEIGADIWVAQSRLFDDYDAVDAFKKAIPGAKACVCTHVSNVFGYILPIEQISDICHEYRVPLVIDASQSAGTLLIDFKRLDAEFIGMPGHKGLMGPQGTGVLLCASPGVPLLIGGTGSDSAKLSMPAYLPDRHEAGTHNIPGIAGLRAGVKFITSYGVENIHGYERSLLSSLARQLSEDERIELFYSPDDEIQSAVMSLRIKGANCESVAAALGDQGLAVRAGLHCAPFAHRTAKTFDTGTVRVSLSPFNTAEEMDTAARIIRDVANIM